MTASAPSPAPPIRRLFNERPLVPAALGFCCGIAALPLLPENAAFIAAPLTAACGVPLMQWRRRGMAVFLFFLAAGLARAALPPFSLLDRLSAWLSPVRDALAVRIGSLFPAPRGVAAGMLLGGGLSDIDYVLRERMMDLGVGHLLAVSGLHVSALAGSFLLIWRCGARRLRNAVLVLSLLFYCVVTVFTPSVVRASVMFLCIRLTPQDRRRDTLSALALSALLLLFAAPDALKTMGFCLSFSCVLGLLFLSPLIARHLSALPHAAASAFAASLSVTLMTFPLFCRFFGKVSALSVLANFFIVSISPFFLVPAFLATALSYLSYAVGAALAVIPRFVLSVMMRLASACSSAALSVPAPGLPAVLLWLAGAAFLSRYCLRNPTRRALYGAGFLLLSLLCWRVSIIL